MGNSANFEPKPEKTKIILLIKWGNVQLTGRQDIIHPRFFLFLLLPPSYMYTSVNQAYEFFLQVVGLVGRSFYLIR